MRFSRPARLALSCITSVCMLASCGTFIALDDDYKQSCEEFITVYRDADGDGEGNQYEPLLVCARPDGYVSNTKDCNDHDPTWNTSAVDDDCDGNDQNCDKTPDDAFFQSECTFKVYLGAECKGKNYCKEGKVVCEARWFFDADGDHYGSVEALPQKPGECPGESWADEGGDCDDADATRNPGRVEICGDDIDQDCDGLTGRIFFYQSFDDAKPPVPEGAIWTFGDGFAISDGSAACGGPAAGIDGKMARVECPGPSAAGELKSPTVETFGLPRLSLHFWDWTGSAPQDGKPPPRLTLKIRQGDKITPISDYTVSSFDAPAGWSDTKLDLTNYIGPSMSVIWAYESGGAPGWPGYAVDEIVLSDDMCELP